MKIKALIEKNKEIILYLVFGVLTTAVNYISYLLLAPFFTKTVIPTVIAWILSVIFAYVTNRIFVFCSDAKGEEIIREIIAFFGARVFSGVLDVAIMWLFADTLCFNDKLIKILSNVIVVILNYIAGKWFVFRKKDAK